MQANGEEIHPFRFRVWSSPGTGLTPSPNAAMLFDHGRAMAKAVRVRRNKDLVRGIGRHGGSQTYHKRGLWAIKAKNGGTFPTHEKAAVAESPAVRAPKFYPADDVTKPLHKNKVINAPKLRTSITPGTVLILLAGHFKGKRVVFLKQLESGLLLVTGPFKVNGVPLRRVNQAYVIATSTKIDISSVDGTKYSDAYFKRAVTKTKKGESEFFDAEEKESVSLTEEKKEDQKAIDAKLIPLIEAVPEMKTYLSARFSLKSGAKPHELVF